MKDKCVKLQNNIINLIKEFEKETEFKVDEIRISRGGCSDSIPYQIYGLYMPITLKN